MSKSSVVSCAASRGFCQVSGANSRIISAFRFPIGAKFLYLEVIDSLAGNLTVEQ